jgi:uncharacterized protein YceH (UPF0502 family)
MDIELTPVEARVLACLCEKEAATPDNYPLTLNALVAACNQKSNRDPVMQLDATDVVRALDSLRDRQLVWEAMVAGSRVPKYQHRFRDRLNLSECQLALLCELILRGPQTPGELRTHASRLAPFESIAAVQAVLDELAARDDGPFVVLLPREPGKREQRHAHLLCGPVDIPEPSVTAPAEPAREAVRKEDERLETLESRVLELQQEVAALRERLETFTRQFE